MKDQELMTLAKETLREQLQLLSEASLKAAEEYDATIISLFSQRINDTVNSLLSVLSATEDC